MILHRWLRATCARPGDRTRRLIQRTRVLRALVYASFGIGTLVVAAPWYLALHDPWRGASAVPSAHPVRSAVAAALLALGAWVYGRCLADFVGPGGGTPAFWEPPRRLVVNPWFRRVRNPMYAAVGTMIAAVALALGSPLVAAWGGGVMVVFHAIVVRFEEPRLRRDCGARYAAYERRVPRWVPGPRTIRRLTFAARRRTMAP